MALDGCRLTMSHTITNQQQAATMGEREERRCNKREARWRCDTIAFRGAEVKGRKKC